MWCILSCKYSKSLRLFDAFGPIPVIPRFKYPRSAIVREEIEVDSAFCESSCDILENYANVHNFYIVDDFLKNFLFDCIDNFNFVNLKKF
jgi:hypothetical protein